MKMMRTTLTWLFVGSDDDGAGDDDDDDEKQQEEECQLELSCDISNRKPKRLIFLRRRVSRWGVAVGEDFFVSRVNPRSRQLFAGCHDLERAFRLVVVA
jgi:hypothetical protein